MSLAFMIQSAVSLIAVILLVVLAGWAKIARPCPPLDEASTRRLLHEEFPGARLDQVWVAADGRGAIARAQDRAMVLFQAGDVYVVRQAPWAAVRDAHPSDGLLRLTFDDVGAPEARLRIGSTLAWPPEVEGAPA